MDFETEQRIARLEQQVALLHQHLGLTGQEEFVPPASFLPPPHVPGEPQDSVPGQPQTTIDPRLPPSFHIALQSGRTISAIKIYREVTGVGLKEAKDYVEALEGRQKRR